MSPETHAAAAASDGFVTYDELRGPDLDAARWIPARLPLPGGDVHIALDPNAEPAVGEGEVRVTIPRFSLAHSAKYLIFSTRQFELSRDRPRDIRRRPRGPEHRRRTGGLPSRNGRLPRLRPRREQAGLRRRRQLHPRVRDARAGGPGRWRPGELFYHVVESPYEDFDDDFTRFRASEITLDRSGSTARPALKTEQLFETAVGVAEQGRTVLGGIPRPLDLALFIQ